MNGSPTIFAPRGAAATPLAHLGWGLTILASAVVVIMSGLLLVALYRHRPDARGNVLSASEDSLEGAERTGRRWILIGTAITTVILLGTFVWSLAVLVDYSRGTRRAAMTVRVTGYRFWWALDYLDARGAVDFTTANELHIPAGTAVRLELRAGDVIHSFWVPELSGKTDLIPGQRNAMWIEGDRPGRFVGQCAEFCGASHANMRIVVYVDPPDEYASWAARQRLPARGSAAALEVMERRGCAACHTVSGTTVRGRAGPDLTHVASRSTIAGGTVSNSAAHLRAWIARPDSVKPGALMPRTGVQGADLETLVRFLESLR